MVSRPRTTIGNAKYYSAIGTSDAIDWTAYPVKSTSGSAFTSVPLSSRDVLNSVCEGEFRLKTLIASRLWRNLVLATFGGAATKL